MTQASQWVVAEMMLTRSIDDAWRFGMPAGEIVRGWVRPDRAVAEAEARRDEQWKATMSRMPESGQSGGVDTYA